MCPSRRLASLMAMASIYSSICNPETSSSSYEANFEKTTNKGLPGHYDKMKHMSRKQRLAYNAKKRKQQKKESK